MSHRTSYKLINAVLKGELDKVRDIIDAVGLSYSKDWSEGYVLLRHAVEKKHTEIIKLLLTRGSKVNSNSRRNKKPSNTPLHFAVNNGDLEIVKMLLDRNANMEAKNICGRTPLYEAVFSEQVEITELLLNCGANVVATDNNDNTTLHRVAMRLLCGMWRISINSMLRTAEISKMLLSKGANVNARNKDGVTPLFLASEAGNTEVLKILLQWGAKVDSKNLEGATPLHFAAESGQLKIVDILWNFGADVDSRDRYGITALHLASKSGHTKVVVALLNYGADVNIMTNKNKYTSLDFAMGGMEIFYDDDPFVDFEDNACRQIAEILSQHIFKLKIANLDVNEKDLLSVNMNSDFKNHCEEEIQRLKSEKIINVSYYDILAKGRSLLAVYARNECIVQVLKSADYKIKFPIYAGIINRNVQRIELLKQYNQLPFSSFPDLPYDCIEKIFSFLNNNHLKNVIDASKPNDIINNMEHTSGK